MPPEQPDRHDPAPMEKIQAAEGQGHKTTEQLKADVDKIRAKGNDLWGASDKLLAKFEMPKASKKTEAKKESSPAGKKFVEVTEKTLALAEKAGELRRQAEAARKTANQAQRMVGAAERYKIKLAQAAAEETDPLEKIRKEDAAGDAALRKIDAQFAFEKAEKFAKAAEIVADKAQKETLVASTEMDKAETAAEQTAKKTPASTIDLGEQIIKSTDKPKPAKALPKGVANLLELMKKGRKQG